MKLSGITRPQKLNMEIRIEGSNAVNDWDFWVYPAQVELAQGNVYTTDTLDAKAISILHIPPTPWTPKHWQCCRTEEMC